MLLSFFRTSGALFHIEEPMTERAICPVLIFRKGQIGFRSLFFVLLLNQFKMTISCSQAY